MTRVTDTSHEHLCTFMAVSKGSIYLNSNSNNKFFRDKICKENQKAHFMFNELFF